MTSPTSKQIGASLARLIATIRSIKQPVKPQPRIANRMSAFHSWQLNNDL